MLFFKQVLIARYHTRNRVWLCGFAVNVFQQLLFGDDLIYRLRISSVSLTPFPVILRQLGITASQADTFPVHNDSYPSPYRPNAPQRLEAMPSAVQLSATSYLSRRNIQTHAPPASRPVWHYCLSTRTYGDKR